MKKNLLIIFFAIVFVACNNQKEAAVLTLNGSVEGDNISELYLYEVVNQHYKFIKQFESIPIVDGKFTYSNDSLPTKLYFIATQDEQQMQDAIQDGVFLFLRKGSNDVKIMIDAENKMHATSDFPLQNRFVEFTAEKNIASNRALLDSLNKLFYDARAADNHEEMKRIKESSMPYYDESSRKESEWLIKQIEENKTSLFGLYLYYTYRFQNSTFSTLDEVAEIRKRLENLDEEAKQSAYFTEMEKKLTILENCAVGHEAPEIMGLDTLDNEVKLSDFRGKYVLVDFWSSSCSWCRLETPNFQKTYNEFKDKNLVILGVSSDHKKDAWIEAIHEDKSYWNQIMMRREEMKEIMGSYAIVGIPEILLVDPQGVILAKGLRGDDIYNSVTEYVK